MKLDTIEYNHVKGHLQLLLSNSKDSSIVIEVTISEERLKSLYRSEFLKVSFKPHKTAYYSCSFQEWFEEHLSEKKAWEIWEGITADQVTVITND